MAMKKSEIQEWLDALPDECAIGVDDGGLCLRAILDPDHFSGDIFDAVADGPWLEIGGIPEYNDDDEPNWREIKCG